MLNLSFQSSLFMCRSWRLIPRRLSRLTMRNPAQPSCRPHTQRGLQGPGRGSRAPTEVVEGDTVGQSSKDWGESGNTIFSCCSPLAPSPSRLPWRSRWSRCSVPKGWSRAAGGKRAGVQCLLCAGDARRPLLGFLRSSVRACVPSAFRSLFSASLFLSLSLLSFYVA